MSESEPFDHARLPDVSRVTEKRAHRYYDRIRSWIHKAVSSPSSRLGSVADYLLLVPDVFILLWRLARDPRIASKHRMLLGTGIAYYLLPFDLLPEFLIGPAGLLDDLVLGVFVLNTLLADTDESILRDHWSGSTDVLVMIRKVLDKADGLVPSRTLKRIKSILRM